MAAQREAIFAAIFARLEALPGINYATRVFESWDDVAPEQSPAVMLRKGPETPANRMPGGPLAWNLSAMVVLYAKNDGSRDTAPSIQLNNLLDAIETAFQRTPIEGPAPGAMFASNPQGGTFGTTLGGLCASCHISGTVEAYDGIVGGAAMAIVPLNILTTA